MDLKQIITNPKKIGYSVEIEKLEEILSNAQYAYHSLGKPIFDDRIYDILYDM